MSAIDAVLFDLYGTLFVYGDMKLAWRDWIEDMQVGLTRTGLHLSIAEVARECDGFFSGRVLAENNLTVYEMRIYKLAVRLGAKPSADWCRDLATESLLRWQQQITLDPQTLATLQALRANGLRTGVLSNFDHYPHVYRILQSAQCLELLDVVIVSGEVGLKKPDAAIFTLATSRLGSMPARTLFVGDHPEQDFEGAHDAGLLALLLQRSAAGVDRLQMNYYADLEKGLDDGAQKKAHRIIGSLADVLSFVSR